MAGDGVVDLAGSSMMDGVVEPPLVSVIVPTRNRAHLLVDSVGSLLNQEYPADRYEIIVVDDGSTDATSSSVLALAESHPTHAIRFLRQSAVNQNAARNTGIKKARGEFIAFIDDDELAPPNWLSGLVAGAVRHPEAGCLGGPYRLRFEGPPPRLCASCWPEGSFDLGEVESEVEDVAGGNMVLRAEMMEATGPFNEALQGRGNEMEWMARHRRAGGVIVYLPSVPVWHRRTRSELRLPNRIRKAYQIGRERARFEASLGRSHSPGTDLARIPRLLAHSVRRTCSGGLTQAVGCLGYVTETTWRRPSSVS
jgi:glucosyl-dolichyl phosphate glucuronosyltransferase